MLWFLIIALLAAPQNLPLTKTKITEIDAKWKTICAFKLDASKELRINLQNLGDNEASGCRILTWYGPEVDDWKVAKVTIEGCDSMVPGDNRTWPVTAVSPNNKMRIQMKSESGTSIGCTLFQLREEDEKRKK